MALLAQLGERGITPQSVETTSTVTFENKTLTRSALHTSVKANGADREMIDEAAAAATAGCPISKVLNLEITLELDIEIRLANWIPGIRDSLLAPAAICRAAAPPLSARLVVGAMSAAKQADAAV